MVLFPPVVVPRKYEKKKTQGKKYAAEADYCKTKNKNNTSIIQRKKKKKDHGLKNNRGLENDVF